MAAEALFGPDAPRIRTIAPGTAFVRELARALALETGLAGRPDALADAIIYVPNRRSARALSLALYDAAGEQTILPPDIRALGDLDSGEPPPIAEQALSGIAPPLSSARQLGEITSLVRQFYQRAMGVDLPPASALASARELSRLLEQAAMSEAVDWSKLDALGLQADLAAHWSRSAEFLKIITQYWPQRLDELGASDPYKERLRAARSLAEHWRDVPPKGPVIIAGSTGATPPGRILMRAVLNMPQGLIVLPGLDTGLSEKQWAAVLKAPGHPQNTLIRTLNALDWPVQDVASWPGVVDDAAARARVRLIHEALAPAEDTADWRATLEGLSEESGQPIQEFVRAGLKGLSVTELPNEAAEAEAAALLMRGTLDEPGKTAALVTPDAGLARRVSALLGRWGVNVPPSAPVPLGRTAAGSLIGLCARWAADPGEPAVLASILKHPFVRRRMDARILDLYFLRGPRRWGNLDELAASIDMRDQLEPRSAFTRAEQDQAIQSVRQLIEAFEISQADFTVAKFVTADAAAKSIADLAGAISETPMPWAGEDGAGASNLLQRLAELGPYLGEMTPQAFADLVDAEASKLPVQTSEPEHPRLSIWGPLEARLQSADTVILAGLNEDVWPEKPPADAFLPRRFRAPLGLNDPEERMGLSAHDFAQLAAAPHVVMLYAARRDDSPAVASRWVWRLRTLAEGAFGERTGELLKGEAGDLPDWVSAIQARGIGRLPPGFSAEPRPKKRAPEDWPRRLSVTRVDRLQRDPYSLWAESVLGLKEVDVLGAPLAANLRGTAIHAALDAFEAEGVAKNSETLLALLREELKRTGEPEASWAGRLAIWEDVVAWYLEWRRGRDITGKVAREVRGQYATEIAGTAFTLSATADRIERTATGGLVIVDFKTGMPPTDKSIAAGFDQQMPLQAVIAMNGGFENVAPAPVEALEYVAVRGKPDARRVGEGKNSPLSLEEMIAAARDGYARLVAAYRSPDAVFASAPRVQFVKYDYGYNLLARRAEWNRDASGGDGGDE
ncbi:double-strand break repair protein AddB [Hyphomonas sp. WL0036]|uniref:double-strand break repair protein AddB n=1 Tax=Hyphomonas sediminis TaxID=2866160 RepID=UPI001C81C723|nr:double-strand break repair protein AddB [Hyphomonas sediminis]MBY9067703.1 double-strand break repair protein AddB [Hyphomonas sediminis]